MHRYIPKIATACVLVTLLWSPAGLAGASSRLHHGHHHLSAYRHNGPPPGVFGTVAAVEGDDSPGTCGTAGASTGTFTLTAFMSSTVWAVTTNASTLFFDPTSPGTFADVCVGTLAGALGTVHSATKSVDPATKVFVAPPKSPPVPPAPHGIFGTVGSVGGVDSPGTCGTAGDSTGVFTVDTWPETAAWTVTLEVSTAFVDQGDPTPSFADVCVGRLVGVTGTVDTATNGVDPATKIFVVPPPKTVPPPPKKAPPPKTSPLAATPHAIFGTVASVGGLDSPGTCGTAGDNTGVFTVDTWPKTAAWAVTLSSATAFVDQGPAMASFGDVCVGDQVGVLGTVHSATDSVDPATKVFVGPAKTPPRPPAPHGSFSPGPTVPPSDTRTRATTAPHANGWSPSPPTSRDTWAGHGDAPAANDSGSRGGYSGPSGPGMTR